MVPFCAAVLAGLGVKTIMALTYFAKKPENGEQDNSIHPNWDQEETGKNKDNKGTPGKVITVNNEDGSSRQVRLLDNPMKVPPKHAHKSLDYDIDVPEDDDFDI